MMMVTMMIVILILHKYASRDLAKTFTGKYDEYFTLDVDTDSLVYLMVANHMLHKFYPSFMITIGEVCWSINYECYVINSSFHIFGFTG